MKSLQNWQECNVVMLLAKTESLLWTDSGKLQVPFKVPVLYPQNMTRFKSHHIYITNPDEEIKEGDWAIALKDGVLMQELIFVNKDSLKQIKESIRIFGRKWSKIIATTDELKISLGKFNKDEFGDNYPEFEKFKSLPRPSNEFIKKYCELGGIDKVLVKYTWDNIRKWVGHVVKENYRPKVAPDNTITVKPIQVKDSWNREEVEELIKSFSSWKTRSFTSDDIKWIKENL